MSKVRAAEPLPLEDQLELVRPPAPGGLELVRRFLNTYDVQRSIEELTSSDVLAAWLRDQGLLGRRATFKVTPEELERLRSIRENLRALARRNNGIDDKCALEELQEASARCGYALTFEPSGAARLKSTAAGVDGVIGTILAAVHAAMADRSWGRLKACADDTCAFAYYDHSKNGCSRWCSPDTCGNRDKVKRYRERKARSSAP
jgi:predicted RNA-binding Zn ribbon-like protein